MPDQPKKSLQEQLAEERAKSGEHPKEKPPLSPQQRIAEAEATLKAIKLEQEVDSARLGYQDFKSRESTIGDREKAITTAQVKLTADQQKLTEERSNLLANYEKHKVEYQDLMANIRIREEEAEKIMSAAIASKADADKVIESRTEMEKVYQEKHDAYTSNMGEAFQLILDLVKILRQESDPTLLQLAVDLKRDFDLMDELNEREVDLQTIADIFSVSYDRILGVCEYIQNSKKSFGNLLKYLMDSAEWLQGALLIEWKPVKKEGGLS